MMKYDKNRVFWDDMELIFKHNIIEAVSINDKLIVVFETNEDNEFDNVYCYNYNQKKLWRIQQVPKEIGGTAKVPYVGVDIKEKKCRVVDFFGRRFIVNLSDGSIISKDIVR